MMRAGPPRWTPRGRRLGLLAGLVGAAVLCGWLGSLNLASLAWRDHLLAGSRPANFPGVVLRDGVRAADPAGRAVLAAGLPNPLFPAEPYRQRAMLELGDGQADAAQADLARALAVSDPSNRRMIYESVLVVGENAATAGQIEPARAAFTLLTRALPDRAAAYVRLGELLRGEHRYPDAVATFRQALAAPDQGADAHIERARAAYWLGALYGALGQPDAALAAYQTVVREDPANTGWWWAWGAYMVLGQDAMAHADRAAATAWFQQAQAAAVTPEQHDQAAQQLQQLGR
jgi:tetratricopeptide (TPR) repeat protein